MTLTDHGMDNQSIWDPELDFGTPAVRDVDVEQVSVTIDGHEVRVPAGTSVLRAATEAGVAIPKLCATDSLKAFGSCRMCLVEVDGAKGVPASCTTPCADGMVVSTQTETVRELRRNVMELYLSDHPVDCDGCARGNCEIQSVAATVGSAEVRYGRPESRDQVANPLPVDESNPYFAFDDSSCIVCSRCVRACSDIQGTFALTVEGRGFDSKISAGGTDFLSSECVSCGACVQACPTSALQEHSVVQLGMPTRSVETTCAYCGVGCSFRAEVQGDGDDAQVVRMIPSKDGGANEGHSCVKGRFAYGYAAHKDRQLAPMVRDSIDDEWRKVSWDEAIAKVATGFQALQAEHGVGAIGGISSSRCTNEEVYVVQKMVRAAFGNNNIDTCARVCHSPTGYGLKQTFGTSAGTQDFRSVEQADVILLIGANPTDAHPVFASRMKRRLREGARLIVADPRRIDLVRSPHVEAAFHLPVLPGSNVAFVNAMAHVIVTEGLHDEEFVRERCEDADAYLAFIADPANSPEAMADATGIDPDDLRAAARLFGAGPNSAIYYGLGVTEHSQGSTMVMGMANLAMVTGNIGREGVGVNPLRGQNNVQGSCDMGSFPHEFPGYRHVSQDDVRGIYEELWGRTLDPEPGLRIPNMFDAALAGDLPRPLRPGRGHRPVRPQHPARRGRPPGDGPRRRPGPVPQRDRPVRPRLPARHVVPGEGRHVHQRRAPDQPGPPGLLLEGRHGRVGDHLRDRPGHGLRHVLRRRVGDHGRDRGHHPDVRRRLLRAARRARLDAVAGLRHHLDRHPDHARGRVRARQGQAGRDACSCRRPSGRPASSR